MWKKPENEEEKNGRERRRHTREAMVRPLRVFRDNDARERVAIGEDVSRSGLRFRSSSRYQPGDRLIVSWCPVDDSAEETWRWARVVRSERNEDLATTLFPRCVAVEFEHQIAIAV